ncbi:flagellar hook-associated protein FlgK [Colwelliaceae bacterium MEBiC 14330]
MTVSLYQTGVSGLLAAQQHLATTGHNISNVNTEGYTRQRAEQNAAVGQVSGPNFIGSGTYIQDITRVYNQFSYKEQLNNQSNLGGADALNGRLTQLDQVMSTSGNALASSIEQLYQGLNGVADNPDDTGLRSIVINQAKTLSNDFNTLNDNIEQMAKSVNGEIEQVTRNISEISLEIAKINDTILQSQGLNQGGQANDLLDKRDQLVSQLSEYTRVNTIVDDNGVMSVMIGQGNTLVAGITPLTLEVAAGDPDPVQSSLRLVGPNSSVALNGAKLGGALGAGFEFRDQHLAQTQHEIDRLAMAISSTLNNSQASGLDLNGQQGINMFTDINSLALQAGRVASPSTNAGNLQAQIFITDTALVPTDQFEVRLSAGELVMTNLTDGSITNLGPANGAGTVHSTPFGFDFVESTGAASPDDSFIITPGKNSAALIDVTLNNTNAIAASSAVGVSASTNNVSDGAVVITAVNDPQAARTFSSITNAGIMVDVYESPPPSAPGAAFEYRVYNAATPPPAIPMATGTYATGSSAVIDLPPSPAAPAFQIEISGQLIGAGTDARETFTIADAFGAGNGSNALAMAKTQEQTLINGNNETFSQNLATATAKVGSSASNAELVADTAQALYNQAYNRNQATSGVNLDEEAANLLKFQQAYQASSQIISTANTIFDTILSAVR